MVEERQTTRLRLAAILLASFGILVFYPFLRVAGWAAAALVAVMLWRPLLAQIAKYFIATDRPVHAKAVLAVVCFGFVAQLGLALWLLVQLA